MLLPTVCDQDRLGLFPLVTSYIFVINYQVKLYHRHINLNISFAGKAESRFQLVEKDGPPNIKCIQFTHPNTSAKYALKVVNQSRVVFEVC